MRRAYWWPSSRWAHGQGVAGSGNDENPVNGEERTDRAVIGGTASAQQPGLVGFSINRNAGSIVSPSARCGVVGLRPTYGRVSRLAPWAQLDDGQDRPHLPGRGRLRRTLHATYGPDEKDLTVGEFR